MKLNKLQQSVVNELGKNILLIASAGTGKTSTLAYRIANIIDSGKAKPDEILCLTFTNRACIEIKSKIGEIVGDAARDVVVRTFHSFCCDIVRLTAKKTSDLFADFIIFDEEDCKSFIEANPSIDPHLSGMIQRFIKIVKEIIGIMDLPSTNRAANYQKAIEQVYRTEQVRLKSCFSKNNRLYDEMRTHGADIIADYDNRLNEAHGLDFDDLIIYANEALQDSEIRLSWQKKFKFINVDEVQDTNELEYKIVSKIFGKSNLLLCGDPFQTIYEWRGSKPKLVEENYKKYQNPKIIVFDENYRATSTLLQASYSYLKKCFRADVDAVYPDDIKVASPDVGEKIVLYGANNIYLEAQWIYNQIENLKVKDLTKICVLTRNNGYNRELAENFAKINKQFKKNIPFMLIDEFFFFRRQEIKDVLAFMKLAVNKHDGMSLERVLKRFSKGIGEATIDNINSVDSHKSGVRLTDFLDPSTHKFGDPYEELLQALETENIVVFDVESTGLDTTLDEIVQIAAVRLDKQGNIKAKFNRILKPTISVGSSAAVHGFTDEYLAAEGEEPRRVFADFVEFVAGAVLVGHNVNYDLSILSSQMSRLSMPPLKYDNYYDTLDIFRRFYPGLENHKLEFLGDTFNVSHKSTHNAYDDICATAELLNIAVEKKILPTLENRRKLIAKYLDKFTNMLILMSNIREKVNTLHPQDLMVEIIKTFGIKEYYEQRKEGERVGYLRDLYVFVKDLDDPALSSRDAIQRILQYTTLSNTELFMKNNTKIPVITVHQAKGMEFDYVFVAGLSEDTFPSWQSIKENHLDEETRLFYVSITRAKKKLFLSFKGRKRSRFINDIPMEYIQNY